MKIRKRFGVPGIFRDWLSMVLGGCLLFVLVELGLRTVFYKKISREKRKIENLAFQPDRDFLVSLKPNIEKQFVRSRHNGGDSISWHTNPDGFRGADVRKLPGTRIMVYGDSNVMARFTRLENTFVYRLQCYLSEHYGTNDIEVLNAGVVGYGPDQSLIRFSGEADKYKPDMVIFLIYADNDFGDIVRNRLYELDSRGKLVRAACKRGSDVFFKRDKLIIVRAVRRLIRNLTPIEHKKLDGQEYIDVVLSANEKEFAIYRESKPNVFSNFSDHYDLDIAIDPHSESARVKTGLMKGILKEASDLAAKKGIKFLVLAEPSAIDFVEDVPPGHDCLSRYDSYRPENLCGVITGICEECGIDNINLFDVFDDHRDEKLYFRVTDHHWNDRAQDVAARATASHIIRKAALLPNGL